MEYIRASAFGKVPKIGEGKGTPPQNKPYSFLFSLSLPSLTTDARLLEGQFMPLYLKFCKA